MEIWPVLLMVGSSLSSLMRLLLRVLVIPALLQALRPLFARWFFLMVRRSSFPTRMLSRLKSMRGLPTTLLSITALVLVLLWISSGWVPTLSGEVWALALLSVSICLGVLLVKLWSSSIVVVNGKHGKEVSNMAYRRRYSGRRSRVRRGRRSRGVNRIGFRM